MLSRWVLSRDRKTATECAEVTRSGRLFQTRAAATWIARSPTVRTGVGCGWQSILEFSSVVWSPYFKTDINKIESVQKRFTKACLPKLNYNERLSMLGLQTLETRRIMRCKFVSPSSCQLLQLPDSVVLATSTSSFKRSLSRFLDTVGHSSMTLCFSLYYCIAVASRLLLFVQPCQCLTLNIVCVYYYNA